jgi:hypothetical protein
MSSTSRRPPQATLLVRHARQGWRDWRQRWTWSRSGGQIVGASQGSLEKVRNTKRRGTAAARGRSEAGATGARSRSQAGRAAGCRAALGRAAAGRARGAGAKMQKKKKQQAAWCWAAGVIFLTCLARRPRRDQMPPACRMQATRAAAPARDAAAGLPGARIGGSACWRGRAEPTVSHRRHRRRPAVLRRRPTAAKACGPFCHHRAARARSSPTRRRSGGQHSFAVTD